MSSIKPSKEEKQGFSGALQADSLMPSGRFISRRGVLALAGVMPLFGPHASAQPRLPVVAFLGFGTQEDDAPQLAALREGLRDLGHIEGRTIIVEARHAATNLARASDLIDELTHKPVDVFIAPGPAATRSLHRRTSIPVVAIGLPPSPGDHGLYTSLSRPGGTVTGFSYFGEELSAKRIEVLRELMPETKVIGVLHNITDPVFRDWGVQTESSAGTLGIRAIRLGLSTRSDGEVADLLASLKAQGGTALIVIRDFLTHSLKSAIVAHASRLGLVLVAEQANFVEVGALMAYGAGIPDLFRRAASYVERIIKGEKAAELPIQLPIKFSLVINLDIAK